MSMYTHDDNLNPEILPMSIPFSLFLSSLFSITGVLSTICTHYGNLI